MSNSNNKDQELHTSLEDPSEGAFLFCSWFSKVLRASDVSGAISVLTARVEQEERITRNSSTSGWLRFVVDDGSIRTRTCDRLKAKAHVIALLTGRK